MPRVVPSQVVAFIDSIPLIGPGDRVHMNSLGSHQLSAVLQLVDQVPDELLTMDNEAYRSLILAKEMIKDILATWRAAQNANTSIRDVWFRRLNNPFVEIRDALAKCPDESPVPGASELYFVHDTDLQTSLRNDIGAINRALSNGEWKATTVLAGSTIEALLLWSLGRHTPAEIAAAITALLTNGKLNRRPDSNLERWDLHEFNEVASNLGIIKDDTYIKTNLAREYRNLIHPGRAQRLGQKCDRGTALASVATLEHVVRDLS